jgi:hypothetical protein
MRALPERIKHKKYHVRNYVTVETEQAQGPSRPEDSSGAQAKARIPRAQRQPTGRQRTTTYRRTTTNKYNTTRTNDIDVALFPSTEGGGRLDGDALFALQVHAVHFGPNAILSPHIVDAIDLSCVVEDPFGQGRFATALY